MRTKRIPVLVDADVYNRVKALAAVQGAPVTRVFNDLATDWMDTVGDTRLEALQDVVANGRAVLTRSKDILAECDMVLAECDMVLAECVPSAPLRLDS